MHNYCAQKLKQKKCFVNDYYFMFSVIKANQKRSLPFLTRYFYIETVENLKQRFKTTIFRKKTAYIFQ